MNIWISRHRSVAQTSQSHDNRALGATIGGDRRLNIHGNGPAGFGLILKLSMSYREIEGQGCNLTSGGEDARSDLFRGAGLLPLKVDTCLSET